MKILITGAHGFVGNRLMQDLDDTVAAPSMRKAEQTLSSTQQQSQMSGRVKKIRGHLMKQMCVCRCFLQKQRKNKN